jgi:hypothetical protein
LVGKQGDLTTGRLTVQIEEKSVSAIGAAVTETQASSQKISQPLVSGVADKAANLPNVVSNQVTNFDVLLNKMGVLIKIGDEVAKVWSTLPRSGGPSNVVGRSTHTSILHGKWFLQH